jgi:hypothetical protein
LNKQYLEKVDAMEIQVQFDLTPVNRQIEELKQLLECLPDGLRDGFGSRIADLADFGLETETLPATATGSYVVRVRSVALAELCTAAAGAADGNST